MSRVLIIDDEQAVCWSLQRALSHDGHEVATASSAEDGFVEADKLHPDVVVLDVRLPGLDGISALARLRELTHEAPIIVVTAFGNLSTAVRAVEGGAFDYLAKPFDLDQAIDAVNRALQLTRSRGQANTSAAEPIEPEEFIGHSPVMQTVFKRIALVAPTNACVLITGESGTGKELVARAIHRYSSRRDRPFLPVHIAALNPNLVESELFGHVKGAFTGAAQARSGLLALAEGGTVFLDELSDVPVPVQVKLLRTLENQEVTPVGGTQSQPLNIRILSATNRDLAERVAQSHFRNDLYYRLNVFQIHLPPLRDRPEDMQPLAEHFLRRFDPRSLPLLPETLRHLRSLPWFGNVRELRNALEHAAIIARGGPIRAEHIPALGIGTGAQTPAEQLGGLVRRWVDDKVRVADGTAPVDLYELLLNCVEPALLDEVMRRVQENRWVAAQWLGLNRATVRKKLAAHKLFQNHNGDDDKEE